MGKRVAPERRTRLDLTITAIFAVAVLITAGVLWYTAPARDAELIPAHSVPGDPPPAQDVPAALAAAWEQPSPQTTTPAITRNSVITGDGGTVTARRLDDGEPIWTYRRSAALCQVIAAWPGGTNRVLAVYRNSRGCSEVISLDAETGERVTARTSDADSEITLTYDDAFALSAGPTRLETWGSSLVRGIEYGRIAAPVSPGKQPYRRDCHIYSALSGAGRVAVVEQCAGDTGFRLSVFGATQDSQDKLDESGSEIITHDADAPPPRVIHVGREAITVYDGSGRPAIPGPAETTGPAIRTFGPDAIALGSRPVPGDPGAPAGSMPISDRFLVTFYTGKATVVLDAPTGRVLTAVDGTLGPGTDMAGLLLLPVPGGIGVYERSGAPVRQIPVTRPADSGIVSLRVLGSSVIEQRDGTVAVLS